jgi:hypothetical protein
MKYLFLKVHKESHVSYEYAHIINMYFEGIQDKQVHTNIMKHLERATVKRIYGLKPLRFDGSIVEAYA